MAYTFDDEDSQRAYTEPVTEDLDRATAQRRKRFIFPILILIAVLIALGVYFKHKNTTPRPVADTTLNLNGSAEEQQRERETWARIQEDIARQQALLKSAQTPIAPVTSVVPAQAPVEIVTPVQAPAPVVFTKPKPAPKPKRVEAPLHVVSAPTPAPAKPETCDLSGRLVADEPLKGRVYLGWFSKQDQTEHRLDTSVEAGGTFTFHNVPGTQDSMGILVRVAHFRDEAVPFSRRACSGIEPIQMHKSNPFGSLSDAFHRVKSDLRH